MGVIANHHPAALTFSATSLNNRALSKPLLPGLARHPRNNQILVPYRAVELDGFLKLGRLDGLQRRVGAQQTNPLSASIFFSSAADRPW
jgi:hypothetical protein